MAHFAKIENNIVTEVVVVDNQYEADGEKYLNDLGLTGTWVQTSYNANFGKKFAAIGDTYIPSSKNFKPAQPFPSWTWSASTWSWIPPVAKPSEEIAHVWNEESQSWLLLNA